MSYESFLNIIEGINSQDEFDSFMQDTFSRKIILREITSKDMVNTTNNIINNRNEHIKNRKGYRLYKEYRET